jgi:hypothetical protein
MRHSIVMPSMEMFRAQGGLKALPLCPVGTNVKIEYPTAKIETEKVTIEIRAPSFIYYLKCFG